MKRFLAILLASALLTPAGVQATERTHDHRKDDGPNPTDAANIVLVSQDGARFRPIRLVVFGRGPAGSDDLAGAYVLPTAQAVPVKDQSKIDLSFIPLLGQVIRQDTATSGFRDSYRVGDVYRLGDALMLRLEPGLTPADLGARVTETLIANRDIAYELRARLRPIGAAARAGLPAPGDLAAQMVWIGEARSNGADLLINVPPSLVRPKPQ